MRHILTLKWAPRMLQSLAGLWMLVAMLSVAQAQGVPPRTQAEMQPYWVASCNCYRNVPWGEAKWFEAPLAREVSQVFDLWLPVNRPAAPMPIVIWAHASGKDHVIVARDSVHKGIVVPALAAGMAVMSVEFRHPVNNSYLGTIYHTDLADATQYIRSMAPELGLDTHNVFLAGRSRGTLGIWTGLQDDRADPNGDLVRRQSTRVNAIFAIEGQTTYKSTENALYLYENERAAYLKRNPENPLYGSAVGSATADDPAVMMRYPSAFFRRLVTRSELKAHHADYGLTLCQRYAELGIGDRCTATDLVPATALFTGVIPFFQSWLTPAR